MDRPLKCYALKSVTDLGSDSGTRCFKVFSLHSAISFAGTGTLRKLVNTSWVNVIRGTSHTSHCFGTKNLFSLVDMLLA